LHQIQPHPADLPNPADGVSIEINETGVLHTVGLRDTLEPDPDNTGVGSFRSLSAFFLESHRERSCFSEFDTRGSHAQIYRRLLSPQSQ
jgi:hypothetical protein